MGEVAGVVGDGEECSFRVRYKSERARRASCRSSSGDTIGGECDERPVEHGTVWKEAARLGTVGPARVPTLSYRPCLSRAFPNLRVSRPATLDIVFSVI